MPPTDETPVPTVPLSPDQRAQRDAEPDEGTDTVAARIDDAPPVPRPGTDAPARVQPGAPGAVLASTDAASDQQRTAGRDRPDDEHLHARVADGHLVIGSDRYRINLQMVQLVEVVDDEVRIKFWNNDDIVLRGKTAANVRRAFNNPGAH